MLDTCLISFLYTLLCTSYRYMNSSYCTALHVTTQENT